MLVLKRRVGEGILIGGNIKVFILAIENNRIIKIGIEAPDNVKIVRSELVKEDTYERNEGKD